MTHPFSRHTLLPSLALVVAAAVAAPAAAHGQGVAVAKDTHPALGVVHRLFDAMRARDTATMRSLFAERASFASWSERNGQPTLGSDSLSAFLRSVGGAPAGLLLDERLYNPRVESSDGVASVWVEYDFYAGERFSHCGIDAIHLAQTAAGWKIVHLIDTRRRTGCPTRPS